MVSYFLPLYPLFILITPFFLPVMITGSYVKAQDFVLQTILSFLPYCWEKGKTHQLLRYCLEEMHDKDFSVRNVFYTTVSSKCISTIFFYSA